MKPSSYNHYTKLDDDYYILCNLLKDTNDVINNQLCEAIHNLAMLDNPDLVDQLLKKGYLSHNPEEETRMMQEKIALEYTRLMNLAKIHTIIVTYQCNFACTYCFEHYRCADSPTRMDEEKINQIFSIIDNYDHDRVSKNPIGIFGGEPLLPENQPLIESILEKGDRMGYSFFIPTNGYYLDQYAELLSRYRIHQLQVTLDGPKQIHDQRRLSVDGKDTFSKIIESIEMSLDYNLPIYIRCNIQDSTLGHLPELLKMINERKWFNFEKFRMYLSPCRTEPGRCFQDFTFEQLCKIGRILTETKAFPYVKLSSEPRRRIFNKDCSVKLSVFHCDACYRQYFYGPDGLVYPCAEAIGNPACTIGTYFPKLEFNKNHEQLITRNVYESSLCPTCNNRYICSSGCPYRALLDLGSLQGNDCGSFDEVQKHRVNVAKTMYRR